MPVFVDTNVLVYSKDSTQDEKQRLATMWLDSLWDVGDGRVSYQVLTEYFMTVTRKLRPGLAVPTARSEVRDLLAWHPVRLDAQLLEQAWSIGDRFGFILWDSLIVAAAKHAQCDILLTEDLQHGQDLDGLSVVSPFLMQPHARLA